MSSSTYRPISRLCQPPGKGVNTVSNIGPWSNSRRGKQNLYNKAVKNSTWWTSSLHAKPKRRSNKFGSETHKSLTSEVPLFGGTLDVVRSFDYGNIQILKLGTNEYQRSTPHKQNWYWYIKWKKDPIFGNSDYRVIAIDMGKTHFGGVLDRTVGSPPRLKRTHLRSLGFLSLTRGGCRSRERKWRTSIGEIRKTQPKWRIKSNSDNLGFLRPLLRCESSSFFLFFLFFLITLFFYNYYFIFILLWRWWCSIISMGGCLNAAIIGN